MDDRACEKCGGFVPRGLGLCSDCGWENDLKYFVRTKPEPVPTADEIKSKQEYETWRLTLPVAMVFAVVLLELAIVGLCSYWGPQAWMGLVIAPYSVFGHCLLLGMLAWVTSNNEERIVQGEGGQLIYWSKALVVTLIAHVSFLVLVAPIRECWVYISDAFQFKLAYALTWTMSVVLISAPGWLAALQIFFRQHLVWGATITAMILAVDAAVLGFAVWWYVPLGFPVFQAIQELF